MLVPPQEVKKPMPKRCEKEGCKRKLDLTTFSCRCGNYFCGCHRLAEEHACTYDYKQEHKQILLKTMSTPVVGMKVEVI